MIFRDELKELMTSLYLTQELEKELRKSGAKGFSLSDKVKSFEVYSEEDFEDEDDNGYSYRQYKRNLLDGHYRPMRWIAHERNQMMHQDNYYIFEFTKFKHQAVDAIDYLNNGMKNSFSFRRFFQSFIGFMFALLPFIITSMATFYFFEERFTEIKLDSIFTYIVAAFVLVIFINIVNILSNIFEMFKSILTLIKHLLFSVQIVLSKNRISIFFILLSYFLWDKKISDLNEMTSSFISAIF